MRIRRAASITIVLTGMLVAIALAVAWTAPDWLVPLLAKRYPGCLYQVSTGQKIVALTIDDGPDPVSTPAILNQLQRHGAKATFFIITSRLPGQSFLMRRLVSEGSRATRNSRPISLRPIAPSRPGGIRSGPGRDPAGTRMIWFE